MSGEQLVAAANIRVKRIYRAARNSDGKRILVDRLWPRGMSRERARLALWMKEVAPSDGLRRWFHSHPEDFATFRERYLDELRGRKELVASLAAIAAREPVTLLYASRNETENHAAILREFLLGESVAPTPLEQGPERLPGGSPPQSG